jgi:hypothetical protein
VWVDFAGQDAKGLISSETSAMHRYLQLSGFDLNGVWLDEGVDTIAEEEYRFLTLMKENSREDLVRCFTAESKLGAQEVKISAGMVTAAQYVCSEYFVYGTARTVDHPIVNLSWGSLDLSEPGQPCIKGTWEQWALPRHVGWRRRVRCFRIGHDLPNGASRLTHGTFIFRRLSKDTRTLPWESPEWRELAGLSNTSDILSTPMGVGRIF